ncbi:MAG: prephenate dehydrogenase, partial [Kiritimatiellae bacterium]|nr:prephenate dehydrogenase [Kiritimatiellia bacterium]
MHVAVIGMGLIGGSFLKAAERAGHTVTGHGRDLVPADLRNADLILIAIPPSAVVPVITRIAPHLKAGAVVVDATGVKERICREMRTDAERRTWHFVGGHPMAGKEVSGWANADADLFRGASMILTPDPDTPAVILTGLARFFREIGFSQIITATPEHHDEMIAFTSQLAHVISSAFVRDPLARHHAGYSAGSFRDMIRVGAPDPDMWTELFLENRTALLPVIDRFIGRLAAFRDALAAADAPVLHAQLEEGREAKRELGNGGIGNVE